MKLLAHQFSSLLGFRLIDYGLNPLKAKLCGLKLPKSKLSQTHLQVGHYADIISVPTLACWEGSCEETQMLFVF